MLIFTVLWMKWHTLSYFAFWSLQSIIYAQTYGAFPNATNTALHSSMIAGVTRRSPAFPAVLEDVSYVALASVTGYDDDTTTGAVADFMNLSSTVYYDTENDTANSTLEEMANSTSGEKDDKRGNGTRANPLVSGFDMKKWKRQREVAIRLRYAFGFSIVVIVLTGTSALIYIGRVTILTRRMCRANPAPRRFQPTADHLRTVDEVIDQFGKGFQPSKQGQPMSISNVVS